MALLSSAPREGIEDTKALVTSSRAIEHAANYGSMEFHGYLKLEILSSSDIWNISLLACKARGECRIQGRVGEWGHSPQLIHSWQLLAAGADLLREISTADWLVVCHC